MSLIETILAAAGMNSENALTQLQILVETIQEDPEAVNNMFEIIKASDSVPELYPAVQAVFTMSSFVTLAANVTKQDIKSWTPTLQ